MSAIRVVWQDAGRSLKVVSVAGSIDSHTFRAFNDECRRHLTHDVVGVVVDLSGVDYVSSAGTGVLIGMYMQLEARRGAFVLAGVRSTVMETFRILGLATILSFAPSVAEALAHVA